MNTSYAQSYPVAAASPAERTAFIRRTYLHLAFAILAFIGVEWFLLQQSWTPALIQMMVGGKFGWLVVLGAFMDVSYLAERLSVSQASRVVQYAGLAIFVLAEAVIFLPLLFMAAYLAEDPNIIMKAGLTSVAVFGGLTLAAFASGK